MSLKAKQLIIALLSIVIVVVLGYVVYTEKQHQLGERTIVVKPASQGCVRCHGSESGGGGPGRNPGLVAHWRASVHAEQGVGCMDCHGLPEPGALPDADNPRYLVTTTWDKSTGVKQVELVMREGRPVERPDIWHHEGADIIVAVSPRSCAPCHPVESAEFLKSRHSSASQFIGSLDNFLGRFAEGPAAANSGCQQCHGSIVRLAGGGDGGDEPPVIAPDSWPNTGIGRVNLDGSWGGCSACHSRHAFAAKVARRPENCGKCHMGPDHPQYEIWSESKHGVAFRANEDEMQLDRPGGEWVLGRHYTQAPSCATCHMGRVVPHANHGAMAATHDVGERISWTLRPRISFKPGPIVTGDGQVLLEGPEERRKAMQTVCMVCHSEGWIEGFYVQFDEAIELHNEKFAKPATAIYEKLQEEGVVDDVPMNEEMDFLYFEIWHHEGRRARHGASMMGPDYVQWHGFYELARNFYTHFLPLAKELAEAEGKGEEIAAFVDETLRGPEGEDWKRYHRWMEGLSEEARAEMLQWERRTYESRKR